MLDGGDYQREMPEDEPPDFEPPGWLEDPLNWIADLFGGGVLEVLLWTVVVAVIGVFIYWLVSEWGRRRRPPEEISGSEPQLPPEIAGPIPDPEELAAEGRYAEAVHAMLLRSIREVARRRPSDLPPALTSREILRQGGVEEEPGRELRGLVLAVEVSRFGGADVDRGDYELCRERYTKFLSLVSGAAA